MRGEGVFAVGVPARELCECCCQLRLLLLAMLPAARMVAVVARSTPHRTLPARACCICAPMQGRSRMLTGEPTLHTRTACMVAEALTRARFTIKPAAGGGSSSGGGSGSSGGSGGSGGGGGGGLYLIECEGAGVAAL